MNNIINLINKEILTEEEKIKSLSDKIRDIKHIYDCLVPNKNKNKRDIINVEKLKNKDNFYEFVDILAYYNSVLYNKFAQVSKEIGEIEESFSRIPVGPLNSVTFLSKTQYMLKVKEKEEKCNQKMHDILSLSFNYIINFYENLEKEKEEKKSLKKQAEYALKNIRNNFPLTFKDINTITLLIEKEEDLNKEELFNELNNYIESKKINQKKQTPKEPLTQEKKNYVDDKKQITIEKTEEKKNPIILNYLTTIRLFNGDTNAINEFLNAISYNDDIEDIINEMLLEIDSDKEKELYDAISNYMVQITYDEFKDDKLLKDEQVNILFYDFINKPEKMIGMIEKNIPKEEFKSLLKAMELLKKDGALANRTTTVLLKKIYKLRVGKVRVTFKRLNHNTYIILGIFRKMNHHGSEIITKTKSRDDRLSRYEKSIIESVDIPEIWDSYLDINEEIYKNIMDMLKKDKNNKIRNKQKA